MRRHGSVFPNVLQFRPHVRRRAQPQTIDSGAEIFQGGPLAVSAFYANEVPRPTNSLPRFGCPPLRCRIPDSSRRRVLRGRQESFSERPHGGSEARFRSWRLRRFCQLRKVRSTGDGRTACRGTDRSDLPVRRGPRSCSSDDAEPEVTDSSSSLPSTTCSTWTFPVDPNSARQSAGEQIRADHLAASAARERCRRQLHQLLSSTRVQESHGGLRAAAFGPLSPNASIQKNPRRRGRAPGIDLPGAGRIRIFSTRRFRGQAVRRRMAVHRLPRAGARNMG